MDRGLNFHDEPVAAAPDRPEQPERALKAARRPSRLLAAIGVDRNWQLLGYDEVFQVRGLPAARVDDRRPAPDSRRTGEVDEVSPSRADGLLDQKMEIDEQGLQSSEPRVALVEMAPARLHEGYGFVGERADRAAQKVRRRDEVGVEDRDERRGRLLEAVGERPRLESAARTAAHVRDLDPVPLPVRDAPGENLDRLVVGVVENLDLEAVARPVDGADGVEDPLRDVPLVVDGQLNADAWLVGGQDRQRGSRLQTKRAQSQVQEIQAKGEQEHAGHRQHRDGDDADHDLSKSVYGRIVERT